MTVEILEKRIQEGWDKYPTPRPYISLKRETYTRLTSPAVFLDEEFGEWTATPDGVMRGGRHPERRQRDYSPLTITKEELHELYHTQNMTVGALADHLNCHPAKVLGKIREFELKKPMSLMVVHHLGMHHFRQNSYIIDPQFR